MVVNVPDVHLCDCEADGELWLPLPGIKREGHTAYHLGKIKIPKFEVWVSTECALLSNYHKVKKKKKFFFVKSSYCEVRDYLSV